MSMNVSGLFALTRRGIRVHNWHLHTAYTYGATVTKRDRNSGDVITG